MSSSRVGADSLSQQEGGKGKSRLKSDFSPSLINIQAGHSGLTVAIFRITIFYQRNGKIFSKSL